MNAKLNMTLKTLIAATTLAVSGGPLFADDSFLIALSPEIRLDRASIAKDIDGSRSVWVQRSYAEQISLGIDPATGAAIHPHRSVQLRYAVDCSKGKLNMTAWQMFSDADARGSVVWADRLEGAQAAYRYAPQSFEERSVMTELCNDSVANLH